MKRLWTVGLALVAMLVVAGAAVGFVSAQTEEGPTEESGAETQKVRVFEQFRARFAENLGITEEELQETAQQTALEMVDDALADGAIDEERAERMREAIENGRYPFGDDFPRKGGPGHHHRGLLLVRQVAEYLELDPPEVVEQLGDGTSLADVIEANGGDVDEFVASAIAQLEERLAEAVTDGKIDQARADEILASAEEKITKALNSDGPFPRLDGAPPRDGIVPPEGASLPF